MLPFEQKPWAVPVAKAVIAGTLLAEVVAVLWLRHYGPLDTPEIVALLLILVAAIPPNIHIIRRRHSAGASSPKPGTSAPIPARE